MKQHITAFVMGAALVAAALPANAEQEANGISFAEIVQECTDKQLQELIEAGLGVNERDSEGLTPLMYAAINQRVDLMYVLLRNGADANIAKDPGITPLTIACLGDNWAMVDLLITHGADVNYTAPNGESVLSLACAQGSVNAAQLLLINKADPNTQDSKTLTPLLYTILTKPENGTEIVRMLLENKADANICTNEGFSPLMAAVQNNDMDSALLLLKHGANVNAAQKEGPTALSIAVALGHTDMVALLLSNKADINVLINTTTSLLNFTCLFARADIMELLLQYGANPNVRDEKTTSTPLHTVATGNELIADAIENMGGGTMLQAHRQHMDAAGACRALLKYGAEVDAAEDNGITPLMIAAMDGCADTVRVLLEHKANINAADAQGRTPLIFAVLSPEDKADISLEHVSPETAQKLRPDVIKSIKKFSQPVITVRLLLENGADVNARDKNGKTARDYATDTEVIRLLEEAQGQ